MVQGVQRIAEFTGSDDFVMEENGILIPSDDAEKLAQALARMIQNQEK